MSANPQRETLGFQAEVKQLLQLVTHSLYSNKEIFLRELISNASDAADKLRYESLTDSALFENDANLKIWIDIDKEKHTITLRDNGIGMSREEVIKNLGTIAESGTREFMKNKLTGDQAKDAHMIGQFGVGFYSSFIVAENVIVRTRRAGMQTDQGVEWESKGEGEYTIKNVNKSDRGTEVVLHIRKEDEEFLDEWRIRQIIRKYSDHILLPIVMKKTEVLEAKEGEEPKTEVKEEVVNQATALWTLPKNKVKDEEYKELYKHIAHDFEDPLIWSHNKVEGKLEYTSLLYIPAHAPFDMWDRNKPRGLKLYVRRVFIMDDAEQLLPLYLRFVRGIVDSNDLPLNVSRELLQSSQVIESIRSACVKRVLDLLAELAENDKEKYQKFWQEFGQVLKEGPGEDFANKDRIVKLLRFASTHQDSPEQTVSLADYIARMPAEQKNIYFITAESFSTAKNSPNLEIFRKKGIEVLLLSDRVDEWLLSQLTEYEGKKFQSVAKGDLDLGALENKEESEKVAKAKDEFSSVLEQMKKVLGEKVKEVRVTDRLTDSPVCVVTDDNGASIHLMNMLKAAGQAVPAIAPILEVNPEHLLIQRLKDVQDEQKFTEWAWVLFDQAQLAQGVQLENPSDFVKRLNQLLAR